MSLSRESENVGVGKDPSGCEVLANKGEDLEAYDVTWTVTQGGNGKAWSRTKAKLEKDDIEAAAKNTKGKLVATTFTAKIEKKTYTVTFDVNAPDGTNVEGTVPGPITVKHGDDAVLPSDVVDLRHQNYKFKEIWNTKSNGEGSSYSAGDTIPSVTGNITLYAQWIKNDAPYDVYFDRNKPSGVDDADMGGNDMEPLLGKQRNETWNLPENTFTLKNHTFLGWSREKVATTKDGFFKDEAEVQDLIVEPPFNTVTLYTVTLYAQWMKKGTEYTVVFDRNTPPGTAEEDVGGAAIDSITMKQGTSQKLPKNTFTLEDHTFIGWSREKVATDKGAFFKDKQKVKDLIVEPPFDTVTLYAQWTVRVHITYMTGEGGSVSSEFEELVEDDEEPKGSIATPHEGYHFVKWTSDKKPGWLSVKATLGKEEIKAVTKEEDESSNLAFTARFIAKRAVHGGEGSSSSESSRSSESSHSGESSHGNAGSHSGGSDYSDEGGYGGRGDRDGKGYHSGWQRHYGKVFYYRNGIKLIGWHELSGTIQNPSHPKKNWFYFGGDGAMLTGRHKLVGGYANVQGIQEQHWFGLEEVTGAQIRGWHKVGAGNEEKWYYYRPQDGAGLVGRYHIVGGFANAQGVQEPNWFFFNLSTGAQIRGWHGIVENGVENWYYYSDGDGRMLKGQHELVGGFDRRMNWFYFDEVTGIRIRGWKHIGYQNKWCYYRDGDGIMLKGQQELFGGFDRSLHWFYFNEETGAQIRGWKYIDHQKKWCYYSMDDGTMLKGQHRVHGGFDGKLNWFYFDEATGGVHYGWKYIEHQNKTCYYGPDGAMYKGRHLIDRKWYYFDEITGARSGGSAINRGRHGISRGRRAVNRGRRAIHRRGRYANRRILVRR